ncbi:MAG: hypothetical protein JRH17_24045 [Deltaproteobacteria bacterium]|nr:hypothetical protein [Deltaproteobacteria bacterium]
MPATDFEGDPRFANADTGYDEVLPDLDLDEVADFIDNCPPITIPRLNGSATRNPDQADPDGDGIGSRCDTCWNVFNPPDPSAPDLDGDGRPDQTTDACPTLHIAEPCPTTNDGTCKVISLVDFESAGIEGTPTVAPFCQGNLHFVCRRDGVPIPQAFFYFTGLGNSIDVIAQGEPTINTCNLEDHLPLLALAGEGEIECDVVFATDIIPPDCDPTVSNCEEEFGTAVYKGEIPAGTITITLDPNAPDPDEACSPGFFKNTLEQWPPTGLSPADDFDTIFGTDAFDPDITLLEAANLGGGDAHLLTRRGVSGLLSALHPGIRYPWSAGQVILIVRGAIDDDPPGEASAAAQTLPVSATSPGGCPLSSGG